MNGLLDRKLEHGLLGVYEGISQGEGILGITRPFQIWLEKGKAFFL